MRTRSSVLLIALALLAQACAAGPPAPAATFTPAAAPATAPAVPTAPAAPTTAPAAAAPAAAAQPAAAATGVTLNVWVRDYTLNMDSPFKTAKAAFEAKHPGVTVNLVGSPYDEQYQKIILSKAGG